jgi:hypothetical protein
MVLVIQGAVHEGEKERIHPEVTKWETIKGRVEYEQRYPFLPARLIDSFVDGEDKISVLPWERATASPDNLRFLIDKAFDDREIAKYNLTAPLRRANS